MSLNNNFKEENIKELLNIEADIAEKNISGSGLTIKVILFTIAGLIGMFLNLLSSHKFILKEVFLIFILIFFIYIFISYIHGVIKILLEEKATALIFRKQFSHRLFRYNPIMLTIFLLFYIFIIISLSLTIPIYEWYYIGLYIFFIPLFVNLIIFLLCSYRQILHPYSITVVTDKINKKEYMYAIFCFVFGICSICWIIYERDFEYPISNISYAFIIFAIIFLIERLLVIYSDNNISQKISDIRRKFLLGDIDTINVARILKFYVIGENGADSVLNVLDDILNFLSEEKKYFNTSSLILKRIEKEILDYNAISNKKTLESLNIFFKSNSSFISNSKIWLTNVKKNIGSLKNDSYRFSSNCLTDNPMQSIQIVEERQSETEKSISEFIKEFESLEKYYEKVLKLVIRNLDNKNYNESDNLDILRQKSLIIANSIEK